MPELRTGVKDSRKKSRRADGDKAKERFDMSMSPSAGE